MGKPFEGSSVFIAGRFERLPKSRVERELKARGAALHRRLTKKTGFAVVTHEVAGRISAATLATVRALGEARAFSEDGFLRALGLMQPLPAKDIEESRFRSMSGLSDDEILLLSLFDILAPSEGKFGFTDLKIGQHVQGLRRRGVHLSAVLKAATELRRRRRGSAPGEITRLDIAPSGDLMLRIGDLMAELDGQMRFAWSETALDPDAVFEAAEDAAAAGDLGAAERLYYACLAATPRDPVVRFNLGNVLRDLGRIAEAKVHFLAAIEADRTFAEAHFNLAHLASDAGNSADAMAHLERAVMIDPDYPDPLYNLAALYIRLDRIADAMPLLERYLKLDSRSSWAREARKLLLACRSALAPRRAAGTIGVDAK
jgi:tetratricopeptide (TPR) repeat protein